MKDELLNDVVDTTHETDESGGQYQCTKQKCKDYGKTFQYASELTKHEG